jgi:hypothetical protein
MTISKNTIKISLPLRAIASTFVFVFLNACAQSPEVSVAKSLRPERTAKKVDSSIRELPLTCTVPPDGTRPDATLVNTDPAVLARFSLQRVMDQLVTIAGTTSTQSGTELYKQLWDTLDTSTSTTAPSFADAPHCNNVGASNGFPFFVCPRPEAALKTTQPDTFVPVAVLNRFDLAPANGAHCGEFRIVYAKQGSPGNRVFAIFEGALANPNPSCGIEACRPIVDFWESLSALPANSVELADALDQFYFNGLPGFRPVVHPAHYGAAGGSGYGNAGAGQIRLNLFGNAPWQLREHHLTNTCGNKLREFEVDSKMKRAMPTDCKLQMTPVTVKSNPSPSLFDSSFADPRTSLFQLGTASTDFPAQVASLANADVNLISMATANNYNATQSRSEGPQGPGEHYSFMPRSSAFNAAISSALIAAASTLTSDEIVARANTQSCAGCHTTSSGTGIGGGLDWPESLGFVHIDEMSRLSPALWCTFLPFRKTVLDNFANTPPVECADILDKEAVTKDTGLTISGRIPGAN